MKRLLSVISVLCILFLFIQINRENTVYSPSCFMTLQTAAGNRNVIWGNVHSRIKELEESVKANIYKYIDKINSNIGYYNYEYYGEQYGYEYIAYTYEDDYDGDGSKEAFVAVGRKTGDTEEYLFGNLYFVSDSEAQLREEAVFIGKRPIFQEENGETYITFDYRKDIQPLQAVYIVADGLAVRQNPAEGIWEEKAVVGNEFTPEDDLKSRIANAEDYREDDYELCSGYAYQPELLDGVGLVNTTENFATYVIGNRGVVVEIAGENYLYADIWYTSNYMVTPRWKEDDFDGDGVNELAMITFVQHGTGFHVESLYMVDRNDAGEWEMYEFLPSDYCPQLRKHFDTVINGDEVRFIFDGQFVGEPELIEQGISYRYDVGNQIMIEYTQEGIEITAEIESMSGERTIDYPWYYISAQVKYQGNGRWQLQNACCRS